MLMVAHTVGEQGDIEVVRIISARRAIDYSDIPPLQEDFWKKAARNPFYRPTKTSTTVRIDSDVLHWLRPHGKGYQSRMNAIPRREMLASLKVTIAKQG